MPPSHITVSKHWRKPKRKILRMTRWHSARVVVIVDFVAITDINQQLQTLTAHTVKTKSVTEHEQLTVVDVVLVDVLLVTSSVLGCQHGLFHPWTYSPPTYDCQSRTPSTVTVDKTQTCHWQACSHHTSHEPLILMYAILWTLCYRVCIVNKIGPGNYWKIKFSFFCVSLIAEVFTAASSTAWRK